HGLTGTNYTTAGEGKPQEARQIPSTFDRVALLVDWVEKGAAPGKSIVVTGGGRSLPMCSYPDYPRYNKGPSDEVESSECSVRGCAAASFSLGLLPAQWVWSHHQVLLGR